MPTKIANLTARERLLLGALSMASRRDRPLRKGVERDALSVPDRDEEVAKRLAARGLLDIVKEDPSGPYGFVWIVLTPEGHKAGRQIESATLRGSSSVVKKSSVHHATKKSPAQLDREITEALNGQSGSSLYGQGRYYLRIKTAPHQQWEVPAGWTWGDLQEAKAGARKADRQWMRVELMDSETGKKARY